jgi:prefoldin subunit 5
MDQALWLAIAGLLVHASWRLSAVATKLDTVCQSMEKHEAAIEKQAVAHKEDLNRVHERIDEVEKALRTTHTNITTMTTQKGARA